MRRLLLRERLYGIKIGPVWAIFPDDLEVFKRIRRGPGRPPKAVPEFVGRESAARIKTDRIQAGTNPSLRRPRKTISRAGPAAARRAPG